MTALVHGEEASTAAGDAAAVLFGGDPLAAPLAALELLKGEVPTTTVRVTDLGDLPSFLARTGLAGSNSEARRVLQQGGYRVNGVTLDANSQLSAIDPLYGRYLLLRRGKSSYHLVEISAA